MEDCPKKRRELDDEIYAMARDPWNQRWVNVDLWLVYTLLKGIPSLCSYYGRKDFNNETTVFLVQNDLATAFTTGMTRSPKGELMLHCLEKDPPEPGVLMYPRDADQLLSTRLMTCLVEQRPECHPKDLCAESKDLAPDQHP